MKIEHRYRSYNHHGKITSYNWTFTFEYNGVTYTGDIEYNVGWNGDGSDGYFMGYLRNPYILRTYQNTYIVFGYSDVRNNVNYMVTSPEDVNVSTTTINGNVWTVAEVSTSKSKYSSYVIVKDDILYEVLYDDIGSGNICGEAFNTIVNSLKFN